MRGGTDYSPNADVKEVTTQTRHPGEKAPAALAEADVALHPASHGSSKMLGETPYEMVHTTQPFLCCSSPASGRKHSPLLLVQMALNRETIPLTGPTRLTITAQSSPHRCVHPPTSSGDAPPPVKECRGFIKSHSSTRLNQGSMQETGNIWQSWEGAVPLG